jgi:thiol-disulfide isomerase/thioredoxin
VTTLGVLERATLLIVMLIACGCAASPGAAPGTAGGATPGAGTPGSDASLAATAGAAPATGAAVPAAAARSAGDPYAALVADDPHGRPIPFGEFAGKVRVIDLWASWCGPCRMTIPELNSLYDQYRDKGLVVIGLSVDDNPADVLEFQRSVPMRYPSGMFNRGLAARIGEPSSIPTTLLIDRKGVLRRTFVGYVDSGTLDPLVRGLL